MAIYVVNSDGSGLARLSTPRNGVRGRRAVWSPGRDARIVFERDGNYLEASVLVVHEYGWDRATQVDAVGLWGGGIVVT